MSTEKPKKIVYTPEFDGMRGMAILAVMVYHASTSYLQGGFIGVDIFFVLSGFLITFLIMNEYDASLSLNLKNFYIRRALRLAPALLTLLLVFSLYSIATLSKEKSESNLIDAIISLFYMSNWARAFSIHPPDYLGHTWSLSIEEQFYILWPVTLWGLLRCIHNRWTIAFIAFAIAVLSWLLRIYLIQNNASIDRLYNGLDTHADPLMIGCVLGIVLSSGLISEKLQISLSKYLPVLAYLAITGLFLASVNVAYTSLHMYYWAIFVIEVLTAILILYVFNSEDSLLKKLLSMKWLVWIGSISYGLYLWHYPIYRLMENLHYSSFEVITFGSFCTFLISIFSFYIIEKPILKLKSRYGNINKVN